jgi:cytochrome c
MPLSFVTSPEGNAMTRTGISTCVAAVLALTAAGAAHAQDAAKGEALFEGACAACHTIDKGGDATVGPNLAGIYGMKAGTKAGFEYSADLKKSGLTWNQQTLDKWLTSPSALVPGTVMGYGGLKDPADRAALIAYMKSKGG